MKYFKLVSIIFCVLFATDLFADDAVYKIGDEGPGGGIVFYYSKAGFPVKDPFSLSPKICHYLECSPVDLGCISWCPKEGNKACCIVQTYGNKEDSVGAGLVNTVNILKAEHKGGELTVSNCAAKLCSTYFTGTTKPGEWYLPSKLELELIDDNLIRSEIIVNKGKWYWSSSQYPYHWGSGDGDEIDSAYGVALNGKSEYSLKYMTSSLRVRAVRAF